MMNPQIKDYDWVDLNMIFRAHTNMNMISDPNIKFEVPIISDELADCYVHTHKEFGQIHIVSRLDAIDTNTVWEFKCVDNLNLKFE